MAATGTYAPIPAYQYTDDIGNLAVGYQLFTYLAGTATKTTTWTDVLLSSANTNPIVMGAAARPTIFLQPGISYKFVMAPPLDSDPPLTPIWTRDNIVAVPSSFVGDNTDIQGTAGENLTAGNAVALSDGSGGNTAGRWYKATENVASLSSAAQAIGFAIDTIALGASGTIRRNGQVTLSGLTPGSIYFAGAAGAVTTSPGTFKRIFGQAETTVLSIVESLPDASTTVSGQITTLAQTLGSTSSTFPKTFGTPPLGLGDYFALASDAIVNNSTAFVDVTGLAFAIGVAHVKEFEFFLDVAAATAADLKFTLTGPAGIGTQVRFYINSTSNILSTAPGLAFGDTLAVAGSGVAVHDLVLIKGVVYNGVTAGTVQLQFAQNVLNVSDATVFGTTSSFSTTRRV